MLQTPVQPEVERVGETIPSPSSALSTSSVMGSTDEEDMTQEAKQCVQALREGKRYSLPALMLSKETVTLCKLHPVGSCIVISNSLASPKCPDAPRDVADP